MKPLRLVAFIVVALFSLGLTGYGITLREESQSSAHISAVVQAQASAEAAEVEKALTAPTQTETVAPRKQLAGTAEKTKVKKTKVGEVLGTLRMPHTGGPIVIKQGTNNLNRETALLNTGSAVRYIDSSKDFGSGVVAISGHRTTYGAVFRNLDLMEKGDTVVVTTSAGKYRFEYATTKIVKPTDVWIITPAKRVKELAGGGLVMSACHPKHSARQRIVVFWKFQSFTPS